MFYAVFSFSIFSDQRSLKIENNNIKTLTLKSNISDSVCVCLCVCSHSPNDVPPKPQRNVSIAAVRGAVRPSRSDWVQRVQVYTETTVTLDGWKYL